MFVTVVLIGIVAYLFFRWFMKDRRLDAIPGPKGLPFVGVSHLMKPVDKMHIAITGWCRQYGPVMKLPLLGSTSVVVSGYDGIREVLVTKGSVFGGRPTWFRIEKVFEKTGIVFSYNPDDKWKRLRKTSQKHLKQFGDGLSRLESLIQDVGNDMFQDFSSHANTSYDPKQITFDTALNSIAFLITGERSRTGDGIINKMRNYETQILRYIGPFVPLSYMIIDFMPWLRHLGIDIWKKVGDLIGYNEEIWSSIKAINTANPDSQSLFKVLMAECDGSDNTDHLPTLTTTDAKHASLILLLAGVTTTSHTFYAAINILAHHPKLQDIILEEIQSVCPDRLPKLSDRQNMPFCQAFLLELLRFTSVAPLGVSHRATKDDETIQGFAIPKDTQIIINIWALHTDPNFWIDPQNFRPERFLDDTAELVPADHPNRKHVMPFGAGPRVCLGENLASARLFLWITRVVNMFSIVPGDGNDPSTVAADNFYFSFILKPPQYKVIFQPRVSND